MNLGFFESIYDGVIKGFNSFIDLGGAHFFVFFFLLAFLIFVLVKVFTIFFHPDSKTARRIKLINKLIKMQKTNPQDNFPDKINLLLTRGKGRLQTSYQAYLNNPNGRITDVFNEPRIQATTTKKNLIRGFGLVCALLLFIVQAAVIANNSAGYLAEATPDVLVFPAIIFILAILFGFGMDFYVQRREKTIKDLSARISASITEFFPEPHKQTVSRTTMVERDGVQVPEVLPLLSEEDYAAEIAHLLKAREQVENEIEARNKTLDFVQKLVDKDIKATEKELNNVRGAMKLTDSVDEQEALRAQEASQIKFVSVLEKLKAAQRKHYDEAETKLQSELSKIDEMIALRKTKQQEVAARQVNQYAEEVWTEVSDAGYAAAAEAHAGYGEAAASGYGEYAPPAEEGGYGAAASGYASAASDYASTAEPKDMNTALNDLLEVMSEAEDELI